MPASIHATCTPCPARLAQRKPNHRSHARDSIRYDTHVDRWQPECSSERSACCADTPRCHASACLTRSSWSLGESIATSQPAAAVAARAVEPVSTVSAVSTAVLVQPAEWGSAASTGDAMKGSRAKSSAQAATPRRDFAQVCPYMTPAHATRPTAALHA